MTTEVTLSQDELRNLLDPERDYGSRSFEDVLSDLDSGVLHLKPGYNLPQIIDSKTHRAVSGTGRPPGSQGPQQMAIAEFRRLALDDVPTAYATILAGVKAGKDWHWVDLFLKYTIGQVGEARGGEEMAQVMLKLMEHFERPEKREIVIEQ